MDAVDPITPSGDELVERARALAPLLYEKSDETERQRCISPEVIEVMRESEIFRLLLPNRFGGLEHDLNTLVRIVCELSAACGSSGWVGSLMMIHQWLCAQFPIEVQEELWGDDPDATIAGSYATSTIAEPERGGYRIAPGRRPEVRDELRVVGEEAGRPVRIVVRKHKHG